jgi:hypothetical protein
MKTDSFFKKLIPFTLILLSVTILQSCQKDEFPDPNTLPQGLSGYWVETNTKSDTLVFNSNDNSGLCSLYRGYEIRNGYKLPVIGSTIYKYEIKPDSIHMVDGLSSAWEKGVYYFNFDEPSLTITIGKFSNYINSKKSTLTFRKIK